jgi:hypothetical protein
LSLGEYLTHLLSSTNAIPIKTSAVKVLIEAGERYALLSEFLAPVLDGRSRFAQLNVDFAAKLGRELPGSDVCALVDELDLTHLSARKELVSRCALALYAMAGTLPVHSLVERAAETENGRVTPEAECAARLGVLIFTKRLEKRQEPGFSMAEDEHLALEALYKVTQDPEMSDKISAMLKDLDPFRYEATLVSLLDGDAKYGMPARQRQRLTKHYCSLVSDMPRGVDKMVDRLENDAHPSVPLTICSELLAVRDGSGAIALIDAMVREVEEERTPRILASAFQLASLVDKTSFVECFLARAMDEAKFKAALSSLASLQVSKVRATDKKRGEADVATLADTLAADLVDSIGVVTLTAWADAGGYLARHTDELVKTAFQRCPDRMTALFSHAAAILSDEHAKRLNRRAGM